MFIMQFPVQLEAIRGAIELRDWFGYWPSFHDAEILSLHLNRAGASTMSVHTWEITAELDANGFSALAKDVVVEFAMKEVFDLSLNGFSQQNVIRSLNVEKVEGGHRLTLEDCFGIAGTIDAKEIRIRLTPGKPQSA